METRYEGAAIRKQMIVITKAAFIAVLFSYLFGVSASAGVPPGATTIGNCSGNSVSGRNNSQTNNCPTYIITPGPQYEIVKQIAPIKNSDGTFTSQIQIHLISTYSPGNMWVAAVGRNVKDIDINCMQTCMLPIIGKYNLTAGGVAEKIGQPFGSYMVTMTLTEITTPINFAVLFNIENP